MINKTVQVCMHLVLFGDLLFILQYFSVFVVQSLESYVLIGQWHTFQECVIIPELLTSQYTMTELFLCVVTSAH